MNRSTYADNILRWVLLSAAIGLSACDRHDHDHHDHGHTESAAHAHGHDSSMEHHQHHHDHGEHDHGLRQHGIHAHGSAELTLALEGNQLVLELLVPGMDIVGFESQPADDVQRQRVEAAAELLRDADQMLSLTGTDSCKLQDVEVVSSLLEAQAEPEEHAEFHVYYEFNCVQPRSLNGIEVHLFRHFTALQRIQLRWIREDLQGAATLVPAQPRVSIPTPR